MSASTGDVSHCLNAGGMGWIDYETETMIVCATVEVTHTLAAEGFDASEDGTGRGTPIVSVIPFDTTQITSAANYSNPKAGDPCHPLAAGAHPPAIAFNSNAQPDEMKFDEHVSAPPTCSQYGAVAFHENQRGEVTVRDTAGTVKCAGGKPGQGYLAALVDMRVRRLTPVECEKLQGFEPGYTAIPKAKDGPRYKALGNSMAVPVMRWIGRSIDYAMLW